MANVLKIDPSRHPLVTGCPPEWASAWGEDRYGIFVAFTLDEITQRLRWIPPGRFWMGSPEDEPEMRFPQDEPGRRDNEGPRHLVYLSRGFWLFDTPCTQALWEAVMGENPSRFKSPDRPVEQVSWDAVQVFIARINARIAGLELGLPTEAQWEHACRAGTETALYTGPLEILGERNAPELDSIAWYGGNCHDGFDLDYGEDAPSLPTVQNSSGKSGTHPVARKYPNAWGLYDMLGNVWEWCADGLREYADGSSVDPHGPIDGGAGRVIRGGSWSGLAGYCRCAFRNEYMPDRRNDNLGFRCAGIQAS